MDNFTKFPNAILEALWKCKISGLDYKVLTYILRNTYGRTDKNGKRKSGGDNISVQKMAEEMNQKEDSVRRSVLKLAKMGILSKTDNRGRPNFISIRNPKNWTSNMEENPDLEENQGVKNFHIYMEENPDLPLEKNQGVNMEKNPDTKDSNKDNKDNISKKEEASPFSMEELREMGWLD